MILHLMQFNSKSAAMLLIIQKRKVVCENMKYVVAHSDMWVSLGFDPPTSVNDLFALTSEWMRNMIDIRYRTCL